ncbi:hypothetical protein ABWH89_18100 [Hoeflea alexandrii]|uniref:hypothetical protein n=1 Tax=Hoeflea alexandrii TaxID=288436 RepID=UPI0035D07735
MGSDLPNSPDWLAQQPSAFDIVTARFPETNPKGELRLRPCLVLEVLRGKNTGRIACRVAYGTKQLKFHQRKRLDVIIQNAADLSEIGLAMATRFDLDAQNLADLPWTEEFFGCWRGWTHPRIGTLPESYIRDYAYCMALRQVNGRR